MFSCLCNQRFVIQLKGTVPRATDHDGAGSGVMQEGNISSQSFPGKIGSLVLAAKVCGSDGAVPHNFGRLKGTFGLAKWG